MKRHGIKLREKVQIPGIPIVWDTNLSDDDLHELYELLIADPDFKYIAESKNIVDRRKGLRIAIRIVSKSMIFKDGFCQCVGALNYLKVIYRATGEWELLDAREREIQELKDEQRHEHTAERNAERLVYLTEDRYLKDRIADCLEKKNYSEAGQLLSLRVKLRKHNPKVKGLGVTPGSLMREGIKIFCNCRTADNGIQFMLEHFRWSWALFDFAKNYWATFSLDRQSKLIEMDKIFEAINEHFQTEGRIHRMICLFLEREGELERAIQHCQLCASRQVSDGKMKEFASRLRSLEKKMERMGLNCKLEPP